MSISYMAIFVYMATQHWGSNLFHTILFKNYRNKCLINFFIVTLVLKQVHIFRSKDFHEFCAHYPRQDICGLSSGENEYVEMV